MQIFNELTEFSYESKLDKTEPVYSFHRFYCYQNSFISVNKKKLFENIFHHRLPLLNPNELFQKYRKFIARNATYFLLNMPNNNSFLILTWINLLLHVIDFSLNKLLKNLLKENFCVPGTPAPTMNFAHPVLVSLEIP